MLYKETSTMLCRNLNDIQRYFPDEFDDKSFDHQFATIMEAEKSGNLCNRFSLQRRGKKCNSRLFVSRYLFSYALLLNHKNCWEGKLHEPLTGVFSCVLWRKRVAQERCFSYPIQRAITGFIITRFLDLETFFIQNLEQYFRKLELKYSVKF